MLSAARARNTGHATRVALSLVRLLLVLVLLTSIASADRAHVRIRGTDTAVAQLARAGRCASKKPSWWCPVAHWDRGTAAPLPFDKRLVGRLVIVGQPGQKRRQPGTVEPSDEQVSWVIVGPPDRPLIKAESGEFPIVQVDGEWVWDERSDDVRLRSVDGVWVAILSPPPAAARSYPDARMVWILTEASE